MALWTLSGTTQLSQYQKAHFAIFWIFWCKMKITIQEGCKMVVCVCAHWDLIMSACHQLNMFTCNRQAVVATKRSQVFWIVAAARRTFNHHHIQLALVTNFIVVGVSSVPRDLAPAAIWLRRFVVSHTQHQTEAALTTWTQPQQSSTSSKQSC